MNLPNLVGLDHHISKDENVPLSTPEGKNMPENVYTFSYNDKKYLIQVFPFNVVVAVIHDEESIDYFSNKELVDEGDSVYIDL